MYRFTCISGAVSDLECSLLLPDKGLEQEATAVGKITFHLNGLNLHFQPRQSQ